MEKFSAGYWDRQYKNNKTGWDVGYASTPIKEFIDHLSDKSLSILVPGAGNAYEVEYLFNKGFRNTFLLDFSREGIRSFQHRCPEFPEEQIICEDFFIHKGSYDLIIEQTFFSSVSRLKRHDFSKKIYHLLNPGGHFAGLLFNHEFDFDGPPYGGTFEEYLKLFGNKFIIEKMEVAYNSIKPRRGRELFVMLRKKI